MKDCLDHFIETVEAKPSALAVIEGDRSVSYSELHGLVLELASGLSKYGPRPKVAFDLLQGVDAYALEIAVLYVGGVFCPLNPLAPIERKNQMIEAFGADVLVLSEDRVAEDYSSRRATYIGTLRSAKTEPIVDRVTVEPEASAYVIFTSGSMGTPKGVEIYRRGLNKFLEWSIPTYGATEADLWAQFSLLSFDLSIVDIFTCLGSGATLVAYAQANKGVPWSLVEKHRLTIWHSVPSVVEFMITRNQTKSVDLSSLRLMSFCGEALKMHQLDFVFERNPAVTVFNTYGPTEGTLFCTWQELGVETYKNHCRTTASIGKPIPGWNILTRPSDESGLLDVILYGDHIGKGYLGLPENNGFGTQEIGGIEQRTFVTGDLIAEQGDNVYFQGRKDRQTKIRGYRVEPAEIDYWITKHTGLASATVKISDGLYSFIESDKPVEEASLRELLKQKLEDFKQPRAFVSLPSLPRNINMKIDYTALEKHQP
ncbi:MAG: AMP-binding protein [Flavobacteriales bacterium]|nr:AMP-binding protein [Flavobacteriales bacterium]